MFDLDKYLADLILNCQSAFGERLLYMGLQGSWLRGEAHENSDIDIMVILDGFSVRDMDIYRGILKEIGFYEKSCGFICGKDEMKCWNPLEVCQLCQTTKDLVGVLIDYLPPATREDEINYVKLSLGNSFLRYKKELLEYGFRVEKISMKEKTVAFIHDRMEKEVSP